MARGKKNTGANDGNNGAADENAALATVAPHLTAEQLAAAGAAADAVLSARDEDGGGRRKRSKKKGTKGVAKKDSLKDAARAEIDAEEDEREFWSGGKRKDEKKSKKKDDGRADRNVERFAKNGDDEEDDADERDEDLDEDEDDEESDGDEEADDSDEDDEEESDEDDDERTAKRGTTVEHRQARSALERDGWSKQELDEMDEDELLRRGRSRVEHYRVYDRTVSENRRLRAGDSGDSTRTELAPPPDIAPVLADPRGSKLGDKLKALTDKLGDDEGTAVREVIEAVRAENREAAKLIVSAFASRDQADGQRLVQAARERLVGRIPELANEDRYRTVRQYMALLAPTVEREDLSPDDKQELLMLQASRAAGLTERTAKKKAPATTEAESEGDSRRAEERRKARRTGQPTTGSHRRAPTTVDAQIRAAGHEILRGGDAARAKRVAGLR